MESKFYNIDELAEKVRGSREYLSRQIRDGKLKAFKQFGKWFVFESDLGEFIRQGKKSRAFYSEPSELYLTIFEDEKKDIRVINGDSLLKKDYHKLVDLFLELKKKEKGNKARLIIKRGELESNDLEWLIRLINFKK